jgi:hypothetical protein
MTDFRKSMQQQLAELEEKEGINVAELRRRGAEARRKAAEEEKQAVSADS